MTVRQFKAIYEILVGFEMESGRKVNFTQYTNGRVSLRFMDMNGEFHAYMINPDGSVERVED